MISAATVGGRPGAGPVGPVTRDSGVTAMPEPRASRGAAATRPPGQNLTR